MPKQATPEQVASWKERAEVRQRHKGMRVRFEDGKAIVEKRRSAYPEYVIAKIKSLLLEGMRVADIIRATGVNRSAIYAVKHEINVDVVSQGRAHRCPGCGGMVYGECILCRVLAAKDRNSKLITNYAS